MTNQWGWYTQSSELKKLMRAMKLTVFMVLFSIGCVWANETYSQNQFLNLNMQGATVKEVLSEIEGQSEFYFMYSGKLIDVNRKVSVNVKNRRIGKVLNTLFDKTDVEYVVKDRIIVLTKKGMGDVLSNAAQQKNIKGTIIDESGEPMPGVTVVIKGTNNGTVTDVDGKYIISNISEDAVLQFSFVGMQNQEIPVKGESEINVTMITSTIGLEEIVAIGYGTVRKRDITGSMSSIKSEDFNVGVTAAPEQLLQGRVAGVNIIQSSGRPGATSTVRIRGTSSISAGNDPLYVIDGIPMQFTSSNLYVNVSGESKTSPLSSEGSNPLNTINPADIESIDILKDASATAIYGSRGANGVILITTKSKNAAKGSLTYDSYFGVSSIRKKLDVLTADEYRDFADSNGLDYSDEGVSTDWQDEIFRTGITQNHNISFGGGKEQTSYRASVGYTNQQGIICGSELDKYTTRFNANHSAIDGKLNISLNLTYAKIESDDVPVSSNISNEGGNMLKDAIRWNPTLPVYNEDGSYYQLGELRVNPVSWQQIEDETTTANFIGGATISYDILKSLKFSMNIGHNNEARERYTYIPASHPVGEAENGRASISKQKNYSSTIETTLTYKKDIGEKSNISLLGGYSFYRYVTENTFTMANEFVSDATKWNLLQSGTVLSNTSYKSANRLMSFFGRANLSLADRYLVTFTLRDDGSSRFGENNRWGLFPSGAFAWQIHEEDFFNIDVINNFKLRLGYGITGNQEIPNDLWREQLTVSGSSTYQIGGTDYASVLPSNYANPDLKWEQTQQLNIGLDFGLFDSRLTGTIDFYNKETKDLLLEFSTVSPSVVSTQWANVGKVQNRGFEITLGGTIINKNDFTWSADVNFAKNTNEVKSLSNDQFSREYITTAPSSGVVAEGGTTQIIKSGLPIGTFWGRKFTGFDSDGMETYLDEDEDGNADEVVIGDANPDFTFGFSNRFTWKRFDASMTLRGVVGNDIYNNTAAEFMYTNSCPGTNILHDALNSGVSINQSAQFSSRWIEKGSYLRLDNISIGYTFDTSKSKYFSNLRAYITGQNLFVITDYSGYDPEVRTNTNTDDTAPIGVDYLAYPRPRIFMVGLSVSVH